MATQYIRTRTNDTSLNLGENITTGDVTIGENLTTGDINIGTIGSTTTFLGDVTVDGTLTGGGGGGGGGPDNTFQEVYAASTSPQVVLTSAKGGVVIKDAATPIAADLLTVQDSAAGTLFSVDADKTHVAGDLQIDGDYPGAIRYSCSYRNSLEINIPETYTLLNVPTMSVTTLKSTDIVEVNCVFTFQSSLQEQWKHYSVRLFRGVTELTTVSTSYFRYAGLANVFYAQLVVSYIDVPGSVGSFTYTFEHACYNGTDNGLKLTAGKSIINIKCIDSPGHVTSSADWN